MVQALGAFLFAATLTAALTEALRRILLRAGRVDRPRPDRWHQQPIPRPGGPAIVLAVLVGVLLFVPRPWSVHTWGWLVGGLFIFAVGLLDDLVDLANPLKLLLLIVAATLPLTYGVSFSVLPAPVGIPAALLWILAMTNAVNWLDNMDGLAAGISAIAAGTLALLSIHLGGGVDGHIAALVAGACVGFLLFNFSPARIFMGDSGSGFLGFSLAMLALLETVRHVTNIVVAFIVPLMVLSIPLFDSAIVTLGRILSGRHLLQGGRDHPSHRLVVLGLSERRAVLYLYALSALSAAAAYTTTRMGALTGAVLLGVLTCVFVGLGAVMVRVRVHSAGFPIRPAGRVVLWQLKYKRRLLEMTLDLIIIGVAYIGAYLLRFEGTVPTGLMPVVSQSLPLALGIKMAVFYLSGLYRGNWRYAGLLDLLTVARASTLASLSLVAFLFLLTRLAWYSRAVFVIDWILTVGLLSSMRLSIRLLEESFAAGRVGGKRVLIAGAGRGGMLLLQELRHNPTLQYQPVGFVDDDPTKHETWIQGVPVLGSCRDIPTFVRTHAVDEVVLAAPSMSGSELERITLLCSEAGVRCRPMRPLLEPAGD